MYDVNVDSMYFDSTYSSHRKPHMYIILLYTYCALTLEEGDAGVVMCHLNWHSKPQEQQDQLLKRPQTYPKLYFHT